MNKIYFPVFFCLIFIQFSFSQESAMEKIDCYDLERHLSFIASDSLQGRKLGTEVDGLEITARYLAGNLKKLGLKSGSENYFQDVELVLSKPLPNNSIGISKNNKSEFTTDNVVKISGVADLYQFNSEQLFYAGFGTQDSFPEDISGKIAFVSQGMPEDYISGKWKEMGWNRRLEGKKIEKLSKRSPLAIIYILSPGERALESFNGMKRWMHRERYVLKSNKKQKDIPVLLTTPDVGDALLGKKGSYLKFLKGKKDNQQLALGKKRVTLSFGSSLEPVNAKNVIGIVEGSDPVLKEECIVFMAHYDHLGVGKDGDVYNGADDNGSGTVTLLEVAEAFAGLQEKPKRSIVFLWVTAEELGLLGSRYYSENPIFPMEKTVMCINIDMDGRVYEPRDSIWKHSPKMVKDFDGLFTLSNDIWPELIEISNAKCKKLGLIPDASLPSRFLSSSDHYHFHNNGVPILNYATGYHADYHKVGDEVSKINFDKMKRVADLCFLVGYEVANMEITKD